MKTIALAGMLACLLAPQDPKSQAEEAIRNTKARKGYATKFKARFALPKSDPIDYDGRSVWVAPGVLYIHYTASGGKDDRVVRAGTRTFWGCHKEEQEPGKCSSCGREKVRQTVPNVWVYHSMAGWVTAEEAANPGLARGIQNPDEFLSVLSRHLEGAKPAGEGIVELRFAGPDIEEVMKEQSQRDAFEWKESSAVVRLHVDSEKLLKKVTCEASLKSADPKVPGTVTYTAEVEVESYEKETEIKFVDEKGKPIPLPPAIQKAVDEVLKSAK